MTRPTLYLNHDADYDWLIALEYGAVLDGQSTEQHAAVSESFTFVTEKVGGRAIGFAIDEFSEFDPEDPEHRAIWSEPRFDVPELGLRDVPAGAIAVAAVSYLDGESTRNRDYFDAAVAEEDPAEALTWWRYCLQTGDMMAHYGLGYTLCELGRHRDAYQHLRAYTELVPTNSWAWCWLGKAAEAVGDHAEAAQAYERATELEQAGATETEAAELLTALRTRTTLGRRLEIE